MDTNVSAGTKLDFRYMCQPCCTKKLLLRSSRGFLYGGVTCGSLIWASAIMHSPVPVSFACHTSVFQKLKGCCCYPSLLTDRSILPKERLSCFSRIGSASGKRSVIKGTAGSAASPI